MSPDNWWVEISTYSTKIGKDGITIKAVCKGETDNVAATGIWVEFVEALHNYSSTLWSDIGDETKKAIDARGGKCGLAAPSGKYGLRNVIAFKFKVHPVGVGRGDTSFVKFDDARQVEGKTWKKTGTKDAKILKPRSFPSKNEAANDDKKNNLGESNDPDSAGHIFAHDPPGPRELEAFSDILMLRYNFNEFIRVSFNNVRPKGGSGKTPQTVGSRCSPKYKWHVRHTFDKVNEKWSRTTGDASDTDDNETDENDIDEDHKSIGSGP